MKRANGALRRFSHPFIACAIKYLIVSITEFSILIGSPRAYLSRNLRTITWVSNNRYPIWTFCNWIPMWFARQSRMLYGFLRNLFTDVFVQTKFSKDILNSQILLSIRLISNWIDLVSCNSGSNRARNYKSNSRFALIRFWNYSRDYPLNCSPLGPITITN